MPVNRRDVLKLGALAGTVAIGGPSMLAAGPHRSTRIVRAIVVGSGFAGGVAAYRLGLAGIQTVVLERGRRWDIRSDGNTFATLLAPDGRLAWLRDVYDIPGVPPFPIERFTGVLEIIDGEHMTVLAGAGVGGGSLVYGTTLAQPPEENFVRSLPSEIAFREMDRIYYPLARRMLGAARVPDDILATPTYLAHRSAIQDANRSELPVTLLESGVNFDIVRQELAGLVAPAFISGLFTLSGANSGAKNSVDRNYLRLAEATGNVEVRPLHQVQMIEERSGGFRVHVDLLDDVGEVIDREALFCRHLFLCAGSLGTTRLLLKSRHLDGLRHLSHDVGQHWATNGDEFSMRVGLGPTGTTMGGPPVVMIEDRENPHGISAVQYAGGGSPAECFCMLQLGMTAGRVTGSLRYDDATDAIVPVWSPQASAAIDAALAHTHAIQDAGTPGSFETAVVNARPNSFHPLGGAVIGKVCDQYGPVHGYRNLFVVDGALIPGYAGARNPALTVTALAERCMAKIVRTLT